jgi:hemolysin III
MLSPDVGRPPGRQPSLGEEIANSLTHGIGLVASLIGIPFLVLAATDRGDIRIIVGSSVFAATLTLLYAASTIYHAIPPSRAKRVLQVVDHAAIYLLIAGTYTPFTIGVMRGAWGWTLFGIVWGLAALGILLKTLAGVRWPLGSILLYLLMGWLAVLALRPLAAALPGSALLWLLAGGLLYTVGVVFFLWEQPKYSHTLWHLFVLGGSGCHYLALLGYLIRPHS